MRGANPLQMRPEWYDRGGAVEVQSYFTTNVAPHALTERWTYTVPSGKKFAAQMVSAGVDRLTAPGAASIFNGRIRYTKSGGGALDLVVAMNSSAAVGAGQSVVGGSTMVALAGDVIAGSTQDLSTTGTVNYLVSMQGVQFDA